MVRLAGLCVTATSGMCVPGNAQALTWLTSAPLQCSRQNSSTAFRSARLSEGNSPVVLRGQEAASRG